MTIDCEGLVGFTQMAGSSALSPVVATGTVSPSAVTRTGAGRAPAGDCTTPATSSVHSTPAPNFESNRRLITDAPFVTNLGELPVRPFRPPGRPSPDRD